MKKDKNPVDVITENLKKSELSKETLLKILIDETEPASVDSAKKTLDKYLYTLLRSDSVAVVGYDLNIYAERIKNMVEKGKINPISNLKANGMIFAWIEQDPLTIYRWLRQMDIYETEMGQIAQGKAYALFKRKIKKLDDEKISQWHQIEDQVSVREPNNIEILYWEASEQLIKIEKEKSGNELEYFNLPDPFDVELKMVELKDQLPQLRKKYEGYKSWSFLEEDIDDFHKSTFYKKGEMTKEKFLKYQSLNKPQITSDEEIRSLFYTVINHINILNQDQKEIEMRRLSFCLSELEGSLKEFEKLINELRTSKKPHNSDAKSYEKFKSTQIRKLQNKLHNKGFDID